MKLKYIGKKNIFLPTLKFYPNGSVLPNKDNIINVTESEAKNLLKYKNGNKPIFEEIKKKKPEIKEDEV
jgi:hypothetical protein